MAKILTPEDRQTILGMRKRGAPTDRICKELGFAPTTVRTVIRRAAGLGAKFPPVRTKTRGGTKLIYPTNQPVNRIHMEHLKGTWRGSVTTFHAQDRRDALATAQRLGATLETA